ncbi:MAG TPA: TonB-dependent receptor plug domain-containing protein, partial [Sphingobacteriaceae bacterium]|nr:TonB-dependent receptor plug domain-containing protein [Sphingobacteriaceae bacterium]
EESASALDEVVVTALGIKREEKSLGYSVERISGENVQRVAQENVLSALAGKVAGVSIANTGGAGSSVNMVIRGATSLSTDNQPLFVIDGVPISSSINNVGGFGGDNRVDYGNAIADLNPNDIEDISILKGPSAAALYGTRAGNGVVLITTKRAIEGQPMKITLSSNTVFDLPYQFLNTQSRFNLGAFSYTPEAVGSGILPEIEIAEFAGGIENDKGYWAVQWDSPLDANGVRVPTEVRSYPNNVKNFLNDYALTTTNSASISNSNPYLNYRLGFTNMTHSGIVPNSDLHRNSLSLAASSTLKKKLTISTNINFTNSYANNRPASNRGANPLEWAYKTPPNANILDLRDYGSGNVILTPGQGFENPYFLAYDVNNSFDRYRIFGNVSVNWQITPSWELMARYSLNKSDQTQESKIAPGGYSKELNNGTYGIATSNGLERNIDLLATYSKDWNFITLSASGGGNMLYSKGAGTSTSAIPGAGLIVPNVFTINNIKSEALSFGNS